MNRPSCRKNKTPDRILTNWDASLSSETYCKLAAWHERREFMAGIVKSGAMLVTLPLWGALSACDRKIMQQQVLQTQPWQTFATVQQHLFPDDGNGPSAEDIHAALYLKFVLEAPDTDAADKTFLLDGIQWLNALTDKQFGKAFVSLEQDLRHQALNMIAGSNAGERWLSHLLLYIMEALLTDPVYGGNPNGIGWQWLEHQPGFPRPPRDKRYTELL